MELVLIIPNICNSIVLKDVLSTLREQDNQDFEIILVLTNTGKNMYATLEKYLDFFGSRLKFITNSKRRSIHKDIVAGFHLVKAKHSFIYFPDNDGSVSLVRQLLECISKYDADILEFRPHLVNTIKWKPSPRLEAKNTFNISKNPEVVAYSYPFLFNKIFKTKLLTSLPKFKFRELNDTKFQVYLNYLLLIHANTYIYTNDVIVRENIQSDMWLAPNNFIYQFNELLNYAKMNNIKLQQEIKYAYYYFLQIFLGGLLKTWRARFSLSVISDYINYSEKRSKKFAEDLYKYLQKMHNEDKLFFETNIYMLKSNLESNSLKYLPNIDKWSDILGEL
ncbi:glycosyltransferase family 2 protein [Mycoplasma bovis]|nr:glycosyltransferase family 2 protein [Mycoplasmopsis bovis]MBT1346822.1 glycosyltransferase family 2 protein [Mycoplasmopsis bovis]MBT1347583.1 glycosyltransferase family 2 protein [Mycoplasmopsis bovis]MBT1348900.1 glycosyltransferase family 2 protein [Mycoplasmopsis bovis]MBT1352126.1 glycosyltransferase family 2 protein [Mycoplasmopsis bovis]